MCKHDEHYNFLKIFPASGSEEILNIDDDTYVVLEGIFNINTKDPEHYAFSLNNAKLIEVLKTN